MPSKFGGVPVGESSTSSGSKFGGIPIGDTVGEEKEVPSNKTKSSGYSALETGAEGFLRGLPATGGFWAGMGAGAAAVAKPAAAIAPAAPYVAAALEVGAGLFGGLIGAGGVDWVTDKLSALMDPQGYAKWKQAQQEHPTAAMVGGFASGFAGSSPKTAAQVAGKWWTTPTAQRGISGVAMAGLDATQQLISTGEIDPKVVAASAIGGAALPGANVLGKVAHGAGAGTVGAFRPKKPGATPTSTPPPTATQEEKQKFFDELGRKEDVVETAFQNPETGEITRSGPKHDEQTKADGKLIPGFVTSSNKFLNRKEAANQAKRSGQLPADHSFEDPTVGLRSGDLRAVGDSRFALKDEGKGVVTPEEGKLAGEAPDASKDQLQGWRDSAQDHTPELSKAPDSDSLIAALKNKYGEDHFISKLMDQLKPIVDNIPVVVARDKEHLGEIFKAYGRDPKEATDDTLGGFMRASDGRRAIALIEGKSTSPVVAAHEMIHAGLVEAMERGGAYAKKLQSFADEINTADLSMLSADEAKALKAVMGKVAEGKLHELQAYGLTQPTVMEALKKLDKVTQKGYLPRFVNAIKEALGLNKEGYDALQKLLDITDVGIGEARDTKGVKTDIPGLDKVTDAVEQAKGSVDKAESLIKEAKDIPDDVRQIESEGDFRTKAADIYKTKGKEAASKFWDDWQEFKQTWVDSVKEIEKNVGINLAEKEYNKFVISNNERILKELIPDKKAREELTYKMDRGEKLTGKEKELADKYRKEVDAIGKKALDAGVIKGWIENYVTRNVVFKDMEKMSKTDIEKAYNELKQAMFGTGTGAGGMAATSKFGKPRRLKSREDLDAYIREANARLSGAAAKRGEPTKWQLELKSNDIADIYREYAQSVETAIANKKLFTNIETMRDAEGGRLIVDVDKNNPMPHGWHMSEHVEFQSKAIHPDIYPDLKFVLDGGPGQAMQALGNISQFVKRFNVIGSFFHAKSLMEVLGGEAIPIYTPVKEGIVLPAVEQVGKLFGKDLKLSAITKALDAARNGGMNVEAWIKDGKLQLEVPEDVSQGILAKSGKLADALISKYGPKTHILESSLSTVEKYTLGLFDKYTWDYLHTGGKLLIADSMLAKARGKALREGREFNEKQQMLEIGRHLNEAFGGLNWHDAAVQAQTKFGKDMAKAAFSPEGRRAMQVGLFAPDWTISTVRAFGSALPKTLNPAKWHPIETIKGMRDPRTKADYARLYQFKTAIMYLTVLNAINMATANRPIWENKDPTRIEFPDGTSIQAMKHAMEPYHWIADPDKTLGNKLGFIPKAAIVGMAGTEYAGPHAQKLVDPSMLGRGKAIAEMALPFQAQASSNAPEGEGAKRALMGTLGFPVYGMTPAQAKAKRAEREKITKENMKEYRKDLKRRGLL